FAAARPFPPRAYWDEATFARERSAIFDRSWLCVGREAELAPGSWLLAPLSDEGVIVVRGADLELRAFRNVCRHRAMPLVQGDTGRARCSPGPYHGWSYALDGALVDAPYAPEGFEPARHGLAALRVEAWAGLVFVTGDEATPPLAADVVGAPPWLVDAPLA